MQQQQQQQTQRPNLTAPAPILLQLYNTVLEEARFHRTQLFRLEQRAYVLEQEILSTLRRRRGAAAAVSPAMPAPTTTTFQPSAPFFVREPTPILRNLTRRNTPSATSSSSSSSSSSAPTTNRPIPESVFSFDRFAEAEEDLPRHISPLLTPLRNRSATETETETETEPPHNSATNFLSDSAFTFLGTFELPIGEFSAGAASEPGEGGGGGGGGTAAGVAEGSGTPSPSFFSTSFARSLLNRETGNHRRASLASSSSSSSSSLSDTGAMFLYFMLENLTNETNEQPHGIADISLFVTDRLFEEIESPPNTCCPIRMDVFTAETEVTQINKCKHIFCRPEIRTWLQTHHTCPLCRTAIDTE